MPRYLPDSSCIVPAVSRWHDHHQSAAFEIRQRRARGETMVVAAHSIVESYAVLTRLPRRERLTAAEAWAVLEANFTSAELVTLDTGAYLALLRNSVADGVLGGQIYDALIAACARAARVDVLLTFNRRHFQRFAAPGLEIVVPGDQARG